jgi:hypothetical protein
MLQQNDHSDYSGIQPKTVRFTVSEPPGFEIVYPADNGIARPGTLSVELSAYNFEVVPPSETNVRGQGHFHLYLDDGEYIPCASTTCDVPDVLPGSHTLKVEMRNNDHSLYGDGSPKTIAFAARLR